MQADGYEVIAAQYGLDTPEEDVATTVRTLGRVGGPAILVGHSYGGSVITAAGADERVARLVQIPRTRGLKPLIRRHGGVLLIAEAPGPLLEQVQADPGLRADGWPWRARLRRAARARCAAAPRPRAAAPALPASNTAMGPTREVLRTSVDLPGPRRPCHGDGGPGSGATPDRR
jgi:pimeloyl-ACP methyl ester carboxylesterase